LEKTLRYNTGLVRGFKFASNDEMQAFLSVLWKHFIPAHTIRSCVQFEDVNGDFYYGYKVELNDVLSNCEKGNSSFKCLPGASIHLYTTTEEIK
jgi:hypothetical protein